MSTVYLLDTSSFVHRAYHASKDRPTYTKDGVPNAAVFLFKHMIQRLRREYCPDTLIAACEFHEPTFRNEIYPDYKANRLTPPEDLIIQKSGCRDVLVHEMIPIVEKVGYEADDIIGTLARETMHRVVIVSGDKDMAQLVTNRVHLLNTSMEKVLDPEQVEHVYGVRPDQIVDLMALRGDATDNVPGAPGIGEKGALAVIQQFGTLEQALARSGEIKHAGWRHAVQQNIDLVRLSKKLVTIDCFVPLSLGGLI